MKNFLDPFIKRSKANESIYRPCFFKLTNQEDQTKLYELIESRPGIAVYDELPAQLEELVKVRNPTIKYNRSQLDETAKSYIGNTPMEEYGVWVYYPWSCRLVHILEEKEFADVRTNRNQYKITLEERLLLSQKKIGVVGLSVGQSVALTMTMERSYGEIRLADFDFLELSNLNRIRTGIHHLGVLKVISVAREIAEIDPFLKVVCFTEGLTEENLDDFFLKGGQLDLVIDECDGLDMKIRCRQKAKALKIPVIMEASDRGTLDVERFDLEPERPLLHGFIDHLDVTKIKNLTNEEKIPFLIPMIGLNTMSPRLKASFLEVEQTISTWPQLGSAVALGGALVADVCRRIALGLFNESGRYFVDFEELVKDGTKKTNQVIHTNSLSLLSEKEMSVIVDSLDIEYSQGQSDLEPAILRELVAAAIKAPSGGNSQPWKWLYKNKCLFLFHDKARSVSFLDFEDTASYIALGAATENLVLKAHSFNIEVETELVIERFRKPLVATFKFFQKTNAAAFNLTEPHPCDELEETINKRQTNRAIDVKQTIPLDVLKDLQKIAETVPGAIMHVVHSEKEMEDLGEIIAKAERLRLMNPEGHDDFVKEIRWTEKEAIETQDGIDLATIDLSPSEHSGLEMLKDWRAIEYLNEWKGGKVFEKLSRKAIASASAIGFITMPERSLKDFFNGGRAVQRVWLLANEHNIAFQPQSPVTFLFAKLMHSQNTGFSKEMTEELTEIRKKFVDLFSIDKELGEIFMFRLSMTEKPAVKSLRHPVDEVSCLMETKRTIA